MERSLLHEVWQTPQGSQEIIYKKIATSPASKESHTKHIWLHCSTRGEIFK
uniref:Uncharacterized protein n=1 Tax=Siphoviridae sp. ctWsj12 TaxID=2826363 RepID=A0A8S5NSB0_9CAUD|nr:MAG TPA: hypothetical protein [Siphoviridae sp. ctWsj12]